MTESIGDVGEDLSDDIKNGGYENYVILTYGLSPSLLEWFPEDSDVLIYTKEEDANIPESEYSDNIRIEPDDIHAKIYLMWDENEISCYLGSFNFTRSGLFNNVEWVTKFTDELDRKPELKELESGGLSDPIVARSEMINQVVDFVGCILSGRDPEYSDNISGNALDEMALVHTEESNTLKKAITDMLSKGDSPTVRYYTPFVNKQGVHEFKSYMPDCVETGDVSFEVYTAMPEKSISGSDNFLKSDHVDELDTEFNSFSVYTRSKIEGHILGEGREIRNGFAHLKVVQVTSTKENGGEVTQTLLTTANLTKNAWKELSGNKEIGVWIRDEESNTTLREFYAENLANCYSLEVDHERIDNKIENAGGGSSTSESYLTDIIDERVGLTDDKISLDWGDTLPEIESISCQLRFKNLVTGHGEKNKVRMSWTSSGYRADISNLEPAKNQILQYIEFDVETTFFPPQEELSEAQIERIYDGNLDTVSYDELILDDEVFQRSELEKGDLPEDPEFVAKREKRDSPVGMKARYSTDDTLFSTYTFFEGHDTRKVTLENDEELPCVVLETASTVEPPFDTITFESSGEEVFPVGFRKEAGRILYLFHPEKGGDTVSATPSEPYTRYYEGRERFELPKVSYGNQLLNKIKSTKLTHSPKALREDVDSAVDTDRYISEETPVSVSLVNETPLEDNTEYAWKVSGYFYRSPNFSELSEAIEPEMPYRHIVYTGVVSVDSEIGELKILTDDGLSEGENSFFVRREVIQEPKITYDGIPNRIPLSSMEENELIAWLVIDLDELDISDISDSSQGSMEVEIRYEGDKLPSKTYSVLLQHKDVYCVPLFKRDIGGMHSHQFLVRSEEVEDNYAWRVEEFPVEVIKRAGKVKLKYRGGTHNIFESSDADSPPSLDIAEIHDSKISRKFNVGYNPNAVFDLIEANEDRVVIDTTNRYVLHLEHH
jgi:hypothetical protein